MSIKSRIKDFLKRQLEKYNLQRILIVVVVLVCCCLAIKYWSLIDKQTQTILKYHQDVIIYIIVGSIALGFLHARFGKANDQQLYFFKFLGPILASPLTTLTYAIVVNSTLGLIYIVCYDTQTILKYSYLDKTTISYTLLLLLTWSVFGLVKILMDIITASPKEKIGEIIENSEAQDHSNADNSPPNPE